MTKRNPSLASVEYMIKDVPSAHGRSSHRPQKAKPSTPPQIVVHTPRPQIVVNTPPVTVHASCAGPSPDGESTSSQTGATIVISGLIAALISGLIAAFWSGYQAQTTSDASLYGTYINDAESYINDFRQLETAFTSRSRSGYAHWENATSADFTTLSKDETSIYLTGGKSINASAQNLLNAVYVIQFSAGPNSQRVFSMDIQNVQNDLDQFMSVAHGAIAPVAQFFPSIMSDIYNWVHKHIH